MKKGKFLERLVGLIEDTIKPNENFTVVRDEKIVDKDGIKRQIDVLIKISGGNRFEPLVILVECKDWAKKVGLLTVGSFINLVDSFNAAKGILVSRKGFTKNAITKAKSSGRILLNSIEENSVIEAINWIEEGFYQYKANPLLDDEIKINLETTEEGGFELEQALEDKNAILKSGGKEHQFHSVLAFFLKNYLSSICREAIKVAINKYQVSELPQKVKVQPKFQLPENTTLIFGNQKINAVCLWFEFFVEVEAYSPHSIKEEEYFEIEGSSGSSVQKSGKAKIVIAQFSDHKYIVVKDPNSSKERYFIDNLNSEDEPVEIFNLEKVKNAPNNG